MTILYVVMREDGAGFSPVGRTALLLERLEAETLLSKLARDHHGGVFHIFEHKGAGERSVTIKLPRLDSGDDEMTCSYGVPPSAPPAQPLKVVR